MSAWMAGVNVSAGYYLSFIDSDDWVETNMMEEMLMQQRAFREKLSVETS